MSEKKAKWIKTTRWIYWTVTLLFAVTMMSAGLTYLAGASFNVEGITHLGYPTYLLKILGIAKFLHRDPTGTVSDPERVGLCRIHL